MSIARPSCVGQVNTYAAGVWCDARAHGVDVAKPSLTQWVGGRSDPSARD